MYSGGLSAYLESQNAKSIIAIGIFDRYKNLIGYLSATYTIHNKNYKICDNLTYDLIRYSSKISALMQKINIDQSNIEK